MSFDNQLLLFVNLTSVLNTSLIPNNVECQTVLIQFSCTAFMTYITPQSFRKHNIHIYCLLMSGLQISQKCHNFVFHSFDLKSKGHVNGRIIMYLFLHAFKVVQSKCHIKKKIRTGTRKE